MKQLILLIVLALGSTQAFSQEFVLQPGNAQALRPLGTRGSTRITEAELRKSQGLTIRIRPDWIWVNGKWDWAFPDSCIQLCRKLGKKYTLLVMGGGSDPLSANSRAWYLACLREMGKRYSSDPLCYMIHASGGSPTGHSEELFWRPMPPAAMTLNKDLIKEAALAFPTQYVSMAGAASDPAAMRELVKYGEQVAKDRFIYKINSLSAKTDLDWTGRRWKGILLMTDAAGLGADIGFEMLDASSAYRFGGTWQQAMAKKAEIEKRTGKTTKYLARYRQDL